MHPNGAGTANQPAAARVRRLCDVGLGLGLELVVLGVAVTRHRDRRFARLGPCLAFDEVRGECGVGLADRPSAIAVDDCHLALAKLESALAEVTELLERKPQPPQFVVEPLLRHELLELLWRDAPGTLFGLRDGCSGIDDPT